MPLHLPTLCKLIACARLSAAKGWIRAIQLTVILLLAGLTSPLSHAGEVFVYSSLSSIRGLDLDQGTDRFLTNSPFASGVNALAYNVLAGIVYYGDQTSVYRWDPALGSGAAAHTLMNDFSVGPLTANITNIGSTAGSYLDDKYYVGSESSTGYIQDIHELTMSIDGTQLVSVRPLNLLTACACTDIQIGGFGDIAALLEGGVPVLYGSSADLSGSGQGTQAGRWKFTPSTGSFQLLAAGSGGQLSGSPLGRLYSNVGSNVQELDRSTGALTGPILITTSATIYDFTGGFALDFGDAPDSYGSAFHRLSQLTSAYIGLLPPDNEAGSLNIIANGVDGAGDDADGTDDEDAVSGTLTISSNNGSYSQSVQCSTGARVSGWIDSNINGVFDVNERNSNHPVSCNAGQATLVWSGLYSASIGATYLRLRASTNGAAVSRATGVASDGEVEDHPVVITGNTVSGNCPAGSTSHIYTANDLPVNIGPNAGTTAVSTISVIETGLIVDVNVLEVQGTHTYINDLIFELSHTGTIRNLYGPSCGSQNDFSFGFDDSASGTPPCPPVDGNIYSSRQSLTQFNGQNLSGDWQLRVRDRFNGDAGVLESWRLELCTSGGGAVDMPNLVLGKNASVSGSQIAFTFSLVNSGNIPLSGLSISDDLAGVFGTGNYTMITPATILSAPVGYTANVAFDGAAENELLSSTAQLLPGEQVDVAFTVSIDTIVGSATPGQYSNQGVATATSTAGTVVTDFSGNGLNLSIDTDDATLFEINASAALSGYVFEDTSLESSTSHDGIKQINELGVSGRVVRAIDAIGTVLSSAITDASGYWQLSVDNAFLNQPIQILIQQDTLTLFISEASLYTVGSVTDGKVGVLPGYGQAIEQINVGVIPRPTFVQDLSLSASPASSATYPHRFTASTFGSLDVIIASSITPLNDQWQSNLYVDADCDEVLDTSESLWSSAIALVKDEELCLLVVETIPSTASNGMIADTTVTAQFSVADESGAGHGVEPMLVNQNVTTVVRIGAGRLELEKTVSNITLGGADLIVNAALPGHILEYRIGYRNMGDGPLTELSIDDAAPAFTQVLGSSVDCGVTPASISCVPSFSGATVNWMFTGTLAAGEQGTVSYQVLID